MKDRKYIEIVTIERVRIIEIYIRGTEIVTGIGEIIEIVKI